MRSARATAHSNIALVKYWGKRPGTDRALNLPAVGSLSLTLTELRTETTVASASRDRFELDGVELADDAARKVFAHLDRVWAQGTSGVRPPCAVTSINYLPTAAGLASSASGFCALTVAAAGAFELPADPTRLSSWARMGSGSAARSIWGGFVRLHRGERADGTDCLAAALFPPDHWNVRLIVVETTRGKKAVGSTRGMEAGRETSPYYPAWVESSNADLDAAERAIGDRDLTALGAVMEHSCFKMHACMMGTDPPLLYWNGTTVEVIQEVWRAREDGLEGYVTIDAGPHVKVLCATATADALAERLARVAGVHSVRALAPGPDASVEVDG